MHKTFSNKKIHQCPRNVFLEWWRHQVETFSALLALCSGNSPVTGYFPAQRPVTQSFDVFFDLRLNKQLSNQPWGWWFEMPSCPLWRHCNGSQKFIQNVTKLKWHYRHGKLAHCGLVTPYDDRTRSTLAQVMACCLAAPKYYPNQC